ncbi:regulatory protein RecX [Acerihabitans sp. KWT182]|uniref:Regulatory protein RecX n=1 Tax=Acerihabitans sp. KWT182 TaxID=3157919 RepID=A0AAU7QC74_9GAMM
MTSLLDRALSILSQRDHSEAELRRKLAQPAEVRRWDRRPTVAKARVENVVEDEAVGAGPEALIFAAELEAAIEYCRQHDWLNDGRFALKYVNSRSNKGYGEQKIRMELMQKGINRDIADIAIAEAAIDRLVQAQTVAWKKFGQPLSSDRLVKIKVQRYLLSRGFSFEEIESIYSR